MCVASNVGDYWKDNFPKYYPSVYPVVTDNTADKVTIAIQKEKSKNYHNRIQNSRVKLRSLEKIYSN